MTDRLTAVYLLETPLDPAKVADILAGEQSSGTFVKVPGETAELTKRSRATVTRIEELEPAPQPSLASAWLTRQGIGGPWRRALATVSFPVDNIGANLATLAATVAGNLYDLGEATGVKLMSLDLPSDYRRRFETPRQGIFGTRQLAGVFNRPLIGTIIKPNVGLSAETTGALTAELCAAGLDFIKDDEVCADPVVAPIEARIRAVMAAVRRAEDKLGRRVMVAFNITDETDAMRRHAELVGQESGTCVMVSLNWCGLSAVQTLRRSTDLVLHGHRNGFGMMSRHPALGLAAPAYQTLHRLAGIDHMHVHGLGGKFADADDEVAAAARNCLTPLADDDEVMPAFSSGQWAATLPMTHAALQSPDFLFLAGGGIMAHPDGPSAGVTSLLQAWEAVSRGEALERYAEGAPELKHALAFFGAHEKK
jgi:ribulose-bisphosphate carboxylase large chain